MSVEDDQSVTDIGSQQETKSDEEHIRRKCHDAETNTAPESTEKVSSQADKTMKPAAPFDPSQFPDGGRDAWLCVAGSAASLFCSFGWVNAVGVFQEYYQNVALRQYSPSTVGWIVSTEVFLTMFMLPWVGLWYDNFGPRLLLLVGTFLHVFGLMMTSLAKEYYQFFLAQSVCSALGAGMIFGPALACNQTWFWKKRGLASGISAAGSSLGGVIFPIVMGRMIDKTGFPWAIRTCAFTILALMIFANLTVKTRLPPKKRKFDLMAFVRPFTEVPFLMLAVGMFLFYYALFMPIAFIVADAVEHGMSVELAQYLVSILNAASVFGRTLPGFIGDKIGRCNTLIIFCTLTYILILAMVSQLEDCLLSVWRWPSFILTPSIR